MDARSMNTSILKQKLNECKLLVKNNSIWYFEDKDGYRFVTKAKNKRLFELLNEIGFFRFHITNKRKSIVTYHQIVAFLWRGWKLVRYHNYAEKGKLEVHHLDHNPRNNKPSNLVYATPTENKVISDITSICCKSNHTPYRGEVKFDLDRINLFRDVSASFCEVLIKSIKATSKNFQKDLFKELMHALPFKQAKLIYNLTIKSEQFSF